MFLEKIKFWLSTQQDSIWPNAFKFCVCICLHFLNLHLALTNEKRERDDKMICYLNRLEKTIWDLAVIERDKDVNHSNKGLVWNLLSKMFSDNFNCHMYWASCFKSKHIFFIDQQEDSILSSGDESSIFILGSKNSVSFNVSWILC